MPSTIIPEGSMQHQPLSKSVSQHHRQPQWKKTINGHMQSTWFQALFGILLLLSLFMADSWVLGNAPDSQNDGLFGTLIAIFVLFMIEWIALSVVQPDYLNSFFFWMDIIGTLSILLDVDWITQYFLPDGAVRAQASVIRATRTAKLGARYGRLLRLIRIMRFFDKIPCLNYFRSADGDYEPTMASIRKISTELSNVLSLRVAALVLLLVIVVPFLNYTITDYSPNAWITNIKVLAKNESTTYADLDFIAGKCRRFYSPKDDQLRSIRIESPFLGMNGTKVAYDQEFKTRDILRSRNQLEFQSSFGVETDSMTTEEYYVTLRIDTTVRNQYTALYGILIIIMVLFLLFTFTASFNGSVNRLVVKPLELMLSTLRNSAVVMLKSLQQLETAKNEEEKEKEADKLGEENGSENSDDEDGELETAMLEKIVEKLSRIMKHVLPNQDGMELDENMDKSTAQWLQQSYLTPGGATNAHSNKAKVLSTVDEDEDGDEAKAMASNNIVSRDKLDSWDFDVLDFTHDQLTDIITYLFSMQKLLRIFNVDTQTFKAFLKEISVRYIENTYHNYKHGCDVCHTSYRLLNLSSLDTVFTKLEVFSVLVAAIAHDVGHPGVNNAYMVKAKHPLAMAHNDKSPLENMHCVVLYEILSKPLTNIFSGMNEPDWRESRKVILACILGTDMAHHFEQISKTQLFNEVNGDDTRAFCSGEKDEVGCLSDNKNRIFIMELVLHCSDISNPFKPFPMCAKWADLVVEEFCLQGDKEKKEGLEISPMCDRDGVVLCNMQMGFIEFVVAPLINALVNIFPPLHEIGVNMRDNFLSWGERRKKK